MAAKYILATVASLFVLGSVVNVIRERQLSSQSRTWLVTAAVFGGVSAWLWLR